MVALVELSHNFPLPPSRRTIQQRATGLGTGGEVLAADGVTFVLVGFEECNARSSWSLPMPLAAKTPVSVMWVCAPESPLTPTAISGGAKEVWVSQFTVAALTSEPSLLLLVTHTSRRESCVILSSWRPRPWWFSTHSGIGV